jgi:hypothetical protein
MMEGHVVDRGYEIRIPNPSGVKDTFPIEKTFFSLEPRLENERIFKNKIKIHKSIDDRRKAREAKVADRLVPTGIEMLVVRI